MKKRKRKRVLMLYDIVTATSVKGKCQHERTGGVEKHRIKEAHSIKPDRKRAV
jgi:hypothetical protein